MDEVCSAQSGLRTIKNLLLPLSALKVFSPEQGSIHTQSSLTECIQYESFSREALQGRVINKDNLIISSIL
jgi:hypothetical protein